MQRLVIMLLCLAALLAMVFALTLRVRETLIEGCDTCAAERSVTRPLLFGGEPTETIAGCALSEAVAAARPDHVHEWVPVTTRRFNPVGKVVYFANHRPLPATWSLRLVGPGDPTAPPAETLVGLYDAIAGLERGDNRRAAVPDWLRDHAPALLGTRPTDDP